MGRDYGYYKAVFADRPPPFAFVDLDLLASNMRQILARAGGTRIRLASKSIRCVAVMERILRADPLFAGLLCFTAAEAAWLSRQGFDDLVVGYPSWHADGIAALCDEVAAGKTVAAMADSLDHIDQLAAVAARRGVVLPVCLDIDLSLDLPGLRFGVWRSPVRSVAQALAVAEAVERSPHLRLDGLMGYEAQVAGLGDRMPGQAAKNAVIRVLKRWSVLLAARRRGAIVGALARRGAALRFVNGGGTGSIETTIREQAVTEVTVGSGFFAPTLFDNYQTFRHLPAAGFAIEIVRRPRADLYTCLGGGYVASGAVGPEKLPAPYLPAGAALLPLEGAGEVQTPVQYRGPVRLAPGDPIFMRHSKAGELCERFNELALVEDGAVVGAAPTYRGQGQAFL
ncbi:MAG TPA: amino acid deaminase/aldolase [Herpetosiphonaceae bacterium]